MNFTEKNRKGENKMVSFKVDVVELERVIKSVKKGIDKKGKDEFRGIRFLADGDSLRVFTSDGFKVFTNSLKFEKETEIEDGFEFVSPVIRIPEESVLLVKITVDYEKNIIEYDFGTSKQAMQLYTLNANIDHVKNWFNISNGTEILFNAKNLKTALDGFGKDERIKLVISSAESPVLIKSVTNENNQRMVSVC